MRTLIIFLFLFFAISHVHAQFSNLGIKGGANMSFINGASGNEEIRIGYNLGIFGILELNDKCRFQPEIHYSAQGYKISDIDEVHRMDYLLMPVLFQIALGYDLWLFLGPQFGTLVNGVVIEKDPYERSHKSGLETFDFSTALGLNLKISEKLAFDGRYVHGHSDVLIDDASMRNRSVQFTIQYTFSD